MDSSLNGQDKLIDIVIHSTKEQINLTTSRHGKFCNVARTICEVAGWDQMKTRFLLDGCRLQNDMTLSENEVHDHAVIEVMFEMVGGKGPTSPQIRKMLEDEKSETNDESEQADTSSETTDVNYKMYEELQQKLQEGKLELDRSNDLDKKLLYLLETKEIQPYELLRLKNLYSFWEEKQKSEYFKPIKETNKALTTKRKGTDNQKKKNGQKRAFESEPEHSNEEATPKKRQQLMHTFELKTPSPLLKMSNISELEMKRISVAIHLWADRKMGGNTFLHNTRLVDSHFNDILKFTGPDSKWKLLKCMTVRQLKSLWRNTYGGKHFFRGHKKTGFENEFEMHISSGSFCPFGHCQLGLMSPMDVDLVVLTPKKTAAREESRPQTSRKLFEDNKENESLKDNEGASQDEEDLMESPQRDSGDNEDISTEMTLQTDSCEVPDSENNCDLSKESKTNKDTHFICELDSCGKVFQTFFGYERHVAEKHSETKHVKKESSCPICDKKVIYLDQHLKAKHSDVQKQVCEICLKEINSNLLKHRKSCNKCRFCSYTNDKKARLLNHINKCDKTPAQMFMKSWEQTEPLNLTSPLKLALNKTDRENNEKLPRMNEQPMDHEPNMDITPSVSDSKSSEETGLQDNERDTISESGNESLEKGRTKFPFDKESDDEDYFSEMDADDTDEFTIERRKNKDCLELQLRELDGMTNPEIEGDDFIVEQFTEFMKQKRHKGNIDEGFIKQEEPTTVKMYASAVKNDILTAFHKLFTPFDARWLLDCKTAKECKFEDEERLHITPEEPIYMTSRVLQVALQRYEVSGNAGTQKKVVIAAFKQLMDFIELHFTLKLNAFGVEVLNKVITYHHGVKSFIKSTSQWKSCNDEEKEAFENNKTIKDYKNPNKDAEVLERYKKYQKSEERISKIAKLLSYAYPDTDCPPAAVMTELGITVMEEIIACTGCRPKVVRHLNMGAVVDAKPGFNPYDITGDDTTVEEEIGDDKIRRRVNPNLPLKEKACIHQLRSNSANCSENCEDQCIPEGFNFWVTWDKTQSTRGPYFLHIPSPIKELMDRYDIVRTNFFKLKKPKFDVDESWLDDDNTHFFLNSQCNSFQSLDLKKLSGVLGIEITAYNFRKIVATWALNHKSKEIREAEEEALQHSIHVAKERYLQSKQLKPQTLTQTYAQEENLFPADFRKELEKDRNDVKDIIKETQEKRAKRRYSKLVKNKEISKKIKFENKPLGPRNSVLDTDRSNFVKMYECVTGSRIENVLTSLKPMYWRNHIVRILHSETGEASESLRRLWVRIYRGDLKHGVRDDRKRAKEQGWPLRKQNPGRKDRSSWIANALRKSCLAAQKFEDSTK